METQNFGAKLRELRNQAGLTQRELADRVNIDFSYLSKIESGVVPPPSEKVISQLAEALNADRDELSILAGRIPPDIAQILKNGKTLQRLRSARAKQLAKSSRKRGETSVTMKRLVSFNKSLSRLAIPVVLVLAVAASLWYAAPARALTIDFPSLPSGTIGSTYSFQVEVSIEDNELLPIKSIDLQIYNVANSATYYDQFTDLALGSTGYVSYTTSGAGADASIRATPDSMWGYFTTGVTSVTWKGAGYTFAPIIGGYGYQTGTGTTSITYDINWTPPSSWPTGGYKIEAEITAQDDQTFTETSSAFTLSAAVLGGGGLTLGPAAPTAGVTDVSDVVTAEGEFTSAVTAESEDELVQLTVKEGTTGLVDKKPLSEISITEMEDPPAPPEDSEVIGLTYDLGPDDATFDPPITLTFTYDPDEIPPPPFDPEDLVIALWDEDMDPPQWVNLDCTVDEETNTITASVSHFTAFTVVAYTEPAAFTTTYLVILPTEVDIGEPVTIRVKATNTGDLSGSYQVVLKIDKVAVATQDVTLDGGASQKLTFTTAKDVAGTYTVNVNGLTGTFTVKAPPASPVAPAPVAPPPVAPLPVVPPTAINWWLIGGIIAAVIIISIAAILVIRRRMA